MNSLKDFYCSLKEYWYKKAVRKFRLNKRFAMNQIFTLFRRLLPAVCLINWMSIVLRITHLSLEFLHPRCGDLTIFFSVFLKIFSHRRVLYLTYRSFQVKKD